MAQTKRKRRTKHRGNAVGMVEVRGRTGRKPTAAEKGSAGSKDKASARERREDRLNKPPTWSGAFQRAAIAAVIFVVVLLAVFHEKPVATVAFGVIMLAFYVPMSYYMDLFVYRRRQAKAAR